VRAQTAVSVPVHLHDELAVEAGLMGVPVTEPDGGWCWAT